MILNVLPGRINQRLDELISGHQKFGQALDGMTMPVLAASSKQLFAGVTTAIAVCRA
ncbi:hypothetical protein LB561_09805 [Mesorhizobium sp. B292B1B]|uniref:hypothetical protein n=1 Tax=unclassified Mesorhizobium TaxID=325217 RepID=UPI0015E29D1B|nr:MULTISPECIES: hypothetical protein [unclassified Mesorhizobium]MCA0012913.1 hypothetical protein [Mesorhizobium sp. B294B1A1]MCA0037586.1 hypothetical protein [Mesorhizobium sp. B292B1B]